MIRKWYDSDINIDEIKNEKIAVIGYGNQGQAQSNNMKDSGLNIIVGLRKDGESWKKAEADGHKVYEIEKAAEIADIVHILVPDVIQSDIYTDKIAPNLKEGNALSFSHGAAIHWKWIMPLKSVDVIMIAPKSPGQRVREVYLENFGTPALVAVEMDFSGRALKRVLAMAKGVGCSKAGVLETTFKEEVETDFFGEQVDLCGGVDQLIRNSFDTLVEAGYTPEIAYFECLHELKLIVDLIYQGGISYMNYSVSDTAEYGGYTRGSRVIDEMVRDEMAEILTEVQDGSFAKEWILENQVGRPVYNALKRLESEELIEEVGAELRQMMPWLKGKK